MAIWRGQMLMSVILELAPITSSNDMKTASDLHRTGFTNWPIECGSARTAAIAALDCIALNKIY